MVSYNRFSDVTSLSVRKTPGEEKHLGFVVLPKPKINGAMYDST
jgi:hypothetical protein